MGRRRGKRQLTHIDGPTKRTVIPKYSEGSRSAGAYLLRDPSESLGMTIVVMFYSGRFFGNRDSGHATTSAMNGAFGVASFTTIAQR